jgi:hypothetical protein
MKIYLPLMLLYEYLGSQSYVLARNLTSVFVSTYTFEQAFSRMKKNRNYIQESPVYTYMM